MSSTIVSVEIPPISTSARRRISEVEPHQNGPAPSWLRPGEQHVEEHALLAGVAVVVERTGVVVGLRSLDQGELRIGEPADRVGQERRQRDVVAVEHGDDVHVVGAGLDLAAHHLQGVVHVAGLGVGVLVAADVAGSVGRAEVGDPLPVTVVEHPRLMSRLPARTPRRSWAR